MKNLPYSFFGCLLFAAGLSSCADTGSAGGGSAGHVQASSRGDKKTADRLFDAVNSYRASNGSKPVDRHAGLDRLAVEHSEYLRQNRGSFSIYGKNVSHYGFDKRAVVARQYLQVENLSENVAAAFNVGSTGIPTIMSLWKESNDHHKNMLQSWTCSGIGVVVDGDGTVFATQIFATRNNSHIAMRERINNF